MQIDFALALDGLLVLLLLVTIIYAFALHRRLGRLRGDTVTFERFIGQLNVATARAEAAVRGLKGAAEQCRATVAEPMSKAEALRDELVFLVERADGAAGRLAGASGRDTGREGGRETGDGGKGTGKEAGAGGRRSGGRENATVQRDDGDRRSRAEPSPDGGAPAETAVGSRAERDLLKALRKARS